jgi:hypothetical protein
MEVACHTAEKKEATPARQSKPIEICEIRKRTRPFVLHTECTTEVAKHFADELMEFVFVKLGHVSSLPCRSHLPAQTSRPNLQGVPGPKLTAIRPTERAAAKPSAKCERIGSTTLHLVCRNLYGRVWQFIAEYLERWVGK